LDTLSELIDIGTDAGLIHVKGNMHYFFTEPITEVYFDAFKKKESIAQYLGKANGETNALTWLQENDWEPRLLALVGNESPDESSDE
jgi:hypothetical protein